MAKIQRLSKIRQRARKPFAHLVRSSNGEYQLTVGELLALQALLENVTGFCDVADNVFGIDMDSEVVGLISSLQEKLEHLIDDVEDTYDIVDDWQMQSKVVATLSMRKKESKDLQERK